MNAKNAKFGWIFLSLLFCSGCASAPPPPLLSGPISADNAALCFSARSDITSIVERFFASRDLTTEEGKIDYLLNRVRDAKVTFIRNREEFTSQNAAKFLRWKLDRLRSIHNMQIDTAQDFVTMSAGSRVSGEPYTVVFPDGSRYPLKDILQNELDQLEACLKAIPPDGTPQLSSDLPAEQPSSPVNTEPSR